MNTHIRREKPISLTSSHEVELIMLDVGEAVKIDDYEEWVDDEWIRARF